MKYPNFEEEKKLWKKGYKCVVGLDEAGRGPLAGPVTAAAVVINPKHEIRNPKQIQNSKVSKFEIRISNLKIRDSKQMSASERENIYKIITRHADISWGVGIVSEKVIDKINILQATKLAMQKALKNLEKKTQADFLLIDGNFRLDKINISQKSVVKGDQKVFSIAAASIIAKVTRDRLMQKYHKKYPQYGFAKHKGYGTKAHFASLKKFGACKIHRKTFWPVSSYVI
jgi:ribonuclease HII